MAFQLITYEKKDKVATDHPQYASAQLADHRDDERDQRSACGREEGCVPSAPRLRSCGGKGVLQRRGRGGPHGRQGGRDDRRVPPHVPPHGRDRYPHRGRGERRGPRRRLRADQLSATWWSPPRGRGSDSRRSPSASSRPLPPPGFRRSSVSRKPTSSCSRER